MNVTTTTATGIQGNSLPHILLWGKIVLLTLLGGTLYVFYIQYQDTYEYLPI